VAVWLFSLPTVGFVVVSSGGPDPSPPLCCCCWSPGRHPGHRPRAHAAQDVPAQRRPPQAPLWVPEAKLHALWPPSPAAPPYQGSRQRHLRPLTVAAAVWKGSVSGGGVWGGCPRGPCCFAGQGGGGGGGGMRGGLEGGQRVWANPGSTRPRSPLRTLAGEFPPS
jgi:hypothetical protein